MKAKIYKLENAGQEVHFPDGNVSVAVCWNIICHPKSIKGKDGLTYKAEVWERNSSPYIDFVSVREYREGEYSKNEDSPVDGGFSIKTAEGLTRELTKAVEYVKSLKRGAKNVE